MTWQPDCLQREAQCYWKSHGTPLPAKCQRLQGCLDQEGGALGLLSVLGADCCTDDLALSNLPKSSAQRNDGPGGPEGVRFVDALSARPSAICPQGNGSQDKSQSSLMEFELFADLRNRPSHSGEPELTTIGFESGSNGLGLDLVPMRAQEILRTVQDLCCT